MRRSRAGRAGSGGAGGVVIAGRRACEAVGERALPAPRRGGAVWRRYLASPGVSDRLCGGDSTDREIHVRRRLLLPVLLALPLLDPGAASAQAAPAELRWTRVPAAELERYEATVVVNGRGDRAAIEAVAGEIVAAGGRAVAHLADVSDPRAVREMVEAAAAALGGGIDIAVSNAGLRRQTPFLDISLAEWREILSVALDGAFVLAQAVVPQMIRRGGGGSIIGLSGVSTHVGTPNRAHVSASKAGLEGLMRALAVELAPHGIRCNCVAPGSIDTVRGASAGARPSTLAEGAVPLRRRGSVEEIAAVVRMLAGPEGGYVTGQTIHVNGGVFLT